MNLFLVEYFSRNGGMMIIYKNNPAKYEINRNPGKSKPSLLRKMTMQTNTKRNIYRILRNNFCFSPVYFDFRCQLRKSESKKSEKIIFLITPVWKKL